jgi:signal transduction histidine kinase
MKIISTVLRKADCARSRLRHALATGAQVPVSPLRIIGILSALLLGITCSFEVLYLYRLHLSQLILISFLQLTLAIWALVEASSRQSIQLQVPLISLKTTLWFQLGLIASRSIQAFDNKHLHESRAFGSSYFSSVVTVGIAFLVFIVIYNQLVNAFSFTEKQRSTQLVNAQMELKSKLRSSLMAAGVGHEINQPLSIILFTTEQLRKEIFELIPEHPQINQRISQISSQSKRVISTIEDMRKLLRNVQTSHSIFDLRAVINSAILHEKYLLSSINACVKRAGLADGIKLLGDSGQIQIAVINVLRNAIEGLSESSQVNPQIKIDLIDSDKTLSIRISDNGPGFPEENLKMTRMSTTKPTGSGIGLYLVNLTMENHSGSLILGTSLKLGGAEVTMTFPKLIT